MFANIIDICRSACSGLRAKNRWRFGTEGITPYHLFLNRVPRGVPGGFWRWIGRLKVLLRLTSLLVFLAALLAFGMPLLTGGQTIRVFGLPALSCVAVACIIHACVQMFGLRMENGRFKRHLIEHSWLICFGCGYSLKGLPSHYRCPECGLPYDDTKLVKAWRRWSGRQIVYSGQVGVKTGRHEDEKSATE